MAPPDFEFQSREQLLELQRQKKRVIINNVIEGHFCKNVTPFQYKLKKGSFITMEYCHVSSMGCEVF